MGLSVCLKSRTRRKAEVEDRGPPYTLPFHNVSQDAIANEWGRGLRERECRTNRARVRSTSGEAFGRRFFIDGWVFSGGRFFLFDGWVFRRGLVLFIGGVFSAEWFCIEGCGSAEGFPEGSHGRGACASGIAAAVFGRS